TSLDVTFSEAIDVASLGQAISLTRNGGSNLINGQVQITLLQGFTYHISGLESLTQSDGSYVFGVASSVLQDLAGNHATADGARSWTVDTQSPDAPANLAISP